MFARPLLFAKQTVRISASSPRRPSSLFQCTTLRAKRHYDNNNNKNNSSQSSQATSSSKPRASSWKVAAAGASGILFVCGLDFVAPRSYPLDDPQNEQVTYWNDRHDVQASRSAKAAPKSKQAVPIQDRPPFTTNTSLLIKDSNTNENNDATHGKATAKAKVVIVGGGFAGLHTALALSERAAGAQNNKPDNVNHTHNNKQNNHHDNNTRNQVDIVILDANRIGQSASGKAKGLVVPGIQVPEEDLAELCGSQALAARVYELTHQAMRRLKTDIVQKYQIDCDWIDSGLVEASIWEEEEETNNTNDDDGHDNDYADGCRDLTASEVRQMLGQPQSSTLYKGGEFDPTCSGVDPFALTIGMANVLEQQWGVRIYENTKVTKVEKQASENGDETAEQEQCNRSSYIVTTSTGATIECQHGPDLVSKELSLRIANAIIPIYTWMASTEPLGDKCPLKDADSTTTDILQVPAPMAGDDFVSLNYWRRTDDGRLLFGSLADAYPIPRWLAEYRLRKALTEIYPHLANVQFDHVWSGTLAFASNAVPLIGRDEGFDYDKNIHCNNSSGGVWYATGFGGHGIVPTAMAGSILADAILGIDDNTWRVFQQEFPPPYAFWPVGRIGGEVLLTVFNVFDWLHVKGVPIPRLPKPW